LLQARRHARANRLLRETPAITAAQLAARETAGRGTEHIEEPPDSALGALARGCAGVVGVLITLVALIGCAATLSLIGTNEDRTSAIVGLVLCLTVLAGGLWLARFGIGPRLRKRATEQLRG
jgi:hypothetical protein